MGNGYPQLAGTREDLDVLRTELHAAAGLLEEAATVWRRAGLHSPEVQSCAPHKLREAALGLASALGTWTCAAAEQRPDLARSAAAQLAGLGQAATRAAAITKGAGLGDSELWTAIHGSLRRAQERLTRLISFPQAPAARAEPGGPPPRMLR
jgi:hypothetical protein